MKKKLKIFAFLLVASYIVAAGISAAMNWSNISEKIGDVFYGTITLSIFALLAICSLIYLLMDKKSGGGARAAGEGKTKAGDNMSQYFDARWITEAELLKEARLMPNTWQSLPLVKKSGIVIRNVMKSDKLLVNMYDPIHTLVIGTTGSGKTTFIIEPAIRILAHTAEKPCMVVTDPKGELYNNHSRVLMDEGYRLITLDLRNPFASTRWNPMDNSYMQYHRAHNLHSEVKVYKNADVHQFKLKTIANQQYGQEWFEFNGVAYPNKELLEGDIASIKQQLIDEAENELREIAATIVTVESKSDSSWERGAQDFLYGLMLAMLEDSLNPELGMTRDRFNFYNLGKIANRRDPDPDNQLGTIRKYCMGRDKLSKVQSLTNTVVNNAPNTQRSYLGVLGGKISIFQDAGICYATSYNDMFFDDFTDKPTVFFIKVPDEKESRHSIATMAISQLYKKLIEAASKRDDLKLPRTVYFLLDEFANLPQIPKMDNIITVARSRKIFFELVVQSYSQLDSKYGKEVAETIRGNCNIQIFLGTEDNNTKELFSKMCGEVSLETKDVSESKSEKKDQGSSKTTSAKIVTRPLIYPYELGQLEFGTAVVKIFKVNPIKTQLTQWFKVPQFAKKQASEEYVPSRALDENKVFYDIEIRNKIIFGSSSSNGGFDDFDFD